MQPLKGITVVTLEHAIAAPFATRQLADLGARVIKVERPGSGDFARSYDQRVRGLASHFVWTNRSKESLTLDPKQPEALAVLGELMAQADVLVQMLTESINQRRGRAMASVMASDSCANNADHSAANVVDKSVDLQALFEQVGLAAKAAGTALALFIDELQYVEEDQLAALITASASADSAKPKLSCMSLVEPPKR